MDLHHKPHPWSGWRDFGKELLTIVLGVLIALGFEQVAEQLHWRHVLAEEREALNSNLQHNDLAMRARLAVEPCVQRRLAELDEVFSRHVHGEPLRIAGPIGRPNYVLGGMQAWDITVADQSLAHMPLAEKGAYVQAFMVWRSYWDTHSEERDDWRQLQALDHPDELTPTDWAALRRIASAARDDDLSMQSGLAPGHWLSPLVTFHLKALPMPDGWMTQPQLAAFCRPMLAEG